MRHGHARWHGRAVVLAWCLGSKNVWVAYRHQLLKVSQKQLRMATITERVAVDVSHQELRAIGENSATDGRLLPEYLDISKDPLPPSAEEFTQMNDSKIEVRDMSIREALHNLTTQKTNLLLMGFRQKRKNQKWRRARGRDEDLRGRELLKRMFLRRRSKNALNALIRVSLVHFQKHRRWKLIQNSGCGCGGKDLRLTTKLIRARDHVQASSRLSRGQPPQERNEILKWTKKCKQRNSASMSEMSDCWL